MIKIRGKFAPGLQSDMGFQIIDYTYGRAGPVPTKNSHLTPTLLPLFRVALMIAVMII